MTTREIVIISAFYLVALCAVIYFTRPTARRIAGALAGGAVVGLMMLGAIVLGEAMGVWHVPFAPTPYFLPLFYLGSAISCSPIYLITWRVERRFGQRGLGVTIAVAALIGPPRDYLYAAKFPAWMVFAPGIAPILADAAVYVGIVALGHAVMRFVSGPSAEDRLGREKAQ